MHEEPPQDREPDSGPADADRPEGGRAGRRRGAREQSPTQRALGLLTRREHSRKELQRKLTSRGMDAAEVETAIEALSGLGWQNDARFAESLVRSRASGGYGPVRVRAELATHGLDGEAIARALDSYEGDWLENARDLVRRRFGAALDGDLALRRKAADFLMRRGFDGERVRKATRFDPDD
ncbi:recombination regulator RecX [Lysobacter sp. CCNWLW3]|uniref:recombination regulator RecX n=1 Tax=unclassified Lysobacter TaxID=2635362 RepID=UPI002FD4494E